MLQDAELAAVTFADADRGWAVGDRGVIWHTNDGGRNWKLQNSGVTCRLEAVQFIDSESGFAVGGWTQPYTHESRGVVLRTRDGGRTWQNTPGHSLPGLKHVRFFGARHGWVLGDSSHLFPSGVFRTEDGGRSWLPVTKGATVGWACGDFVDVKQGALAGLDGTLGVVSASEIRRVRRDQVDPRYLQRMILRGESQGWLVGDAGLVLTTSDGGGTWNGPRGSIPEIAAANLDFRAVAAMGGQVWIAGAPGTCVLHSPDGGQSWQLFRTGQAAPLRGLTFIDESRGWAVGSMGTILHTRDGGKSWRVQRSGGSRVALLGIFSEPARVPLELVAAQAGSEAYLTAVEIIGRHDQNAGSSRSEDFALASRSHAAVVAAGGSGADTSWRFPLHEPAMAQTSESILARWNLANDGHAKERLEEHVVRRIRQWRPEVIVTEDISLRGENPLAHLTNRITLDAAAKAADPGAYPRQINELGLTAWKVKKVFTVLPPEKQGLVNLTPSLWSPRLARTVADQAALGRTLLTGDVQTSPRTIGLSLLVDHLPQDSGKRDVMSGINLQPGSEARRTLSHPATGNMESLSRVAQRRHNIEQLLERIDTETTVGAGWIGQAGDLTKELSSRQAGEILWKLGCKYYQAGKCEQAAEALGQLLEKHPQHPLADAAAKRLIQYYASGEMAWRQRQEAKADVRVAAAASGRSEIVAGVIPVSNSVQIDPAGEGQISNLGDSRASFDAMPEANSHQGPAGRAGRALALANQIEQARPVLAADPAVRYSAACAARQVGQARTAEKIFQRLASGDSHGLWGTNAAAEQWLLRPSGEPPKKICSVVTALQKPKLDGRLDDPVWNVAKAVSLKSGENNDANIPAAAVLAFDEQFLYIALSCRKAPGLPYTVDAEPRSPDSDLSRRDHVVVLLDIDRDYGSYWRLAVDHCGRPADDCCGDTTWNPEWFVAASGDVQYWTVEAAIPLTQLTAKKPEVRDVWAIGIQRVIPQIGLQSFTTPAAIVPRPEGFGLMVFE
jgi:photosystem II stability/assembly factor-like uncharacterized protein